jgi:hypothetical protein
VIQVKQHKPESRLTHCCVHAVLRNALFELLRERATPTEKGSPILILVGSICCQSAPRSRTRSPATTTTNTDESDIRWPLPSRESASCITVLGAARPTLFATAAPAERLNRRLWRACYRGGRGGEAEARGRASRSHCGLSRATRSYVPQRTLLIGSGIAPRKGVTRGRTHGPVHPQGDQADCQQHYRAGLRSP